MLFRSTFWLGGDPPPSSCSRALESSTAHQPYKCSGVDGSCQCPPAFSTTGVESGGLCSVRQLHSSLVHQPPRGHSVCPAVCDNVAAPALVHGPRHIPLRDPHPGRGEQRGRCPVPGLDLTDRVDPEPGNCPLPVSAHRPTTRRPVCGSKQPSAAGILRKGVRPLCVADRCPSDSVGWPVSVCLSPDISHSSGSHEARTGGLQSPPHSSVLASPAVVREACPTAGSQAGGSTAEGRYPLSARLRSPSPSSGESPPNVLGFVTQSLRAAGLSQRAADIAARSRRSSTREIYDSRLRRFHKWCRARSLHPANTSVGQVADFLVYLFDSGLTTATVKNYRSAIAAIHGGFPDGSSVSNNDTLGQLIKGMFTSRPPTRKLVPSWDLFTVLTALSRPPFEPLSGTSLLNLSVKVAFLIAVATSRRRSELCSLTLEPGHIRWEPGGVRLIPRADFLTKNQSESFAPPDIFLPDIKSLSTVPQDKLWCPVRALKWYLGRTNSLRHGPDGLFITTTPPHRPASRDTIARWLVMAIKTAGALPSSEPANPVHAHEVRAASSSWAFFKGASIHDITQAACWKNPNTFTQCYLKDVLQAEGRAGRVVLQSAARTTPPQPHAESSRQ